MQAYEFIDGFRMVIERFGQWPSFHDGEVHRIVLDRTSNASCGRSRPTVEVHVRGWIMGPDVDAEGFYKLRSDSVVVFLFEGIFDLKLEGFNQQNVLSSLNLSIVEDSEGSDPALHVELEHCYLFAGEFSARKARVVSVAPYEALSDG
ncbi:MAG: hypothetical protein CFE46_15365 [Burkholderiales bacterium PBB6]|jgi:hypothetical protein|nr:MAG: hypothetical protein CFE46_15365 [Burkholderiales bacterium PBB6]